MIGRFFIILSSLLLACNSAESNESRWWTEEERRLILSELARTTGEIRTELANLSEEQASFRETADRWNILEIIEHLEMQNQLHFRELSVIANSPQYNEFCMITNGNDDYFTKYATDTIRGQANWFLQPKGKFCSLEDAASAFYLARTKLVGYVTQTNADLRKQFTFRAPVYERNLTDLKIGEVRDLHQLLLTGIAHTDRHLRQIRTIKTHNLYPAN